MANVRCAGHGRYFAQAFSDGLRDTYRDFTKPCGWQDYRKANPAYGKPTSTLSCPHCGGRVEPATPRGAA